jgi:hypothetical protein
MLEWLKKLFMTKKSEESIASAQTAAPETPEETAGATLTGEEGSVEEAVGEDLK